MEIKNSSFMSESSYYLSVSILFSGRVLSLKSKKLNRLILIILNFLDVKFKNNTSLSYSAAIQNNNRGLGTLNFMGGELNVENCLFQYNINDKGAGIFVDSTPYLNYTNVTIINTVFDTNSAQNGGAIYMGYNIWELYAIFQNFTCTNNMVTSCIFFFFRIGFSLYY